MGTNAKDRFEQCAYCGDPEGTTRDHIPPKCIFDRPLPQDLITVPCCEKCRAGWSDDDEYFRAMILPAISGDPRAKKAFESVMRSLRRPSHTKFASMLASSVTRAELVTEAGLHLGNVPALKPDIPRMERVLTRIVRGLFFHEFGRPLPEGYKAVAQLDQFGEGSMQWVKLGGCHSPRSVGEGRFIYTYSRAEGDPNVTSWQGAFYEQFSFVGFVGAADEIDSIESEVTL